ncbi:putative Phospho-N-acetylmuramoyl-pentapeptide-transferase [Candidatus Moduliflexus flocculans]|uniref:Putative Phospho-N-acetylmuramoyl-pentapeptide-transferase n=1 Tax=Candidatus Moduliflexus flocculans TaxID=1499966 RepID=A0A081BNZ5_9BACT|nr:putative Phospho-N-acetylmuramoyl-pentapeptide-transferase [Candidatus Moduliflexus flocculans]
MKTHISRSVFFLLLLLFVLPLSDVLPSSYVFIKYPFTFLLAFSLALWATPLARNAALRYNIVDKPDGRLKDHAIPTPYLGGIVVYIAFLLTLACTFGFTTRVLGITLAGAVLVIVGLFDDMRAVTPGVKFLGQLIAILVLIKSGIRIELISLPNWISLPFTVLWVAGVINAINIIDIMDGLATGVAFCASITLFIVSLLNGQTMIGIMTIALAGSLLGLLRYNFEPAQIYLGDTGSMFIGLMLGALAMIGEYTEQTSLGVVAPILILGVPIFDMLFVMILRYRKGISMFLGSKDHYALRCRKAGFSVKQIALMSYAATMVFGGCALLIMQSSFAVSFIVLMTIFAGVGVVAYRLAQIDMPSNTQVFQGEVEHKNR